MFPRLRTLVPLVLLCGGTQRRHCSSAPTPPTSPHVLPSSSTPTATKRTRNDTAKTRFVDWSPGVDYYFGKEEAERYFFPADYGMPGRRRRTAGQGGDEGAPPPPVPTRVSGPQRTEHLDTAIPPLRREEVERWRLEGSVYMTGACLQRHFSVGTEVTLLPRDAMVTYLGDDMHKIDQLYRKRGLYTPSEVAEALFPFVPSYHVDMRDVLRVLPNSLLRKAEVDFGRDSVTMALFTRFPMLFRFNKVRGGQSPIALNRSFWFVRQHPSYGKADRLMQKYRIHSSGSVARKDTVTLSSGATVPSLTTAAGGHNDDAATTSSTGRTTLSVKLFQALVRNLPRFPAPPPDPAIPPLGDSYARTKDLPHMQQRYAARNLVQWVQSFRDDDARLVSGVSELEVVRVLCQYPHVFQLVSRTAGEPNIFVDGATLLAARKEGRAAPVGATAPLSLTDGNEDDVTSAEGWDGDELLEKATSAPGEVDCSDTTTQRAAAFQQALKDDLIDLDGILDAPQHAPLSSRGGAEEVEDTDASTWEEEEEAEDGELRDSPDEGHDAEGEQSDTDSDMARGGSEDRDFRGPLPAGAQVDALTAFGLPLEEIFVRRLPPDVAPRSLGDWDEHTSPDVELAALAARFLAPSPSTAFTNATGNFFVTSARRFDALAQPPSLWRWVPVNRLYHGYTVEQRHHLRREYKGLVNFLRYHGKLFELSNDLMYVIAHDPEGAVPPIHMMERRFLFSERVVLPRTFDDSAEETASFIGENEQAIFERTLANSMPTNRRDVLLLDPTNPLLIAQVLHEEIANLLPSHPVPLRAVTARMPPLMRAMMPYRMNFRASQFLVESRLRGQVVLQRRADVKDSRLLASKEVPMSVEDAIAEILGLQIDADGVSVKALQLMHLSAAAVDTLCDHYGSLKLAIDAFPQYFEVDVRDLRGRQTFFVRFRSEGRD